MKTLFASLVAIFLAFFIGCQESSITDPVSNDAGWNLSTADKDVNHYYPGAIKLEGWLSDPINPSNTISGTVKMNGVAKYKLELVQFDPAPPAPQSAIKVKLNVKAELYNRYSNQDEHVWFVTGTSEDLVIRKADQQFYFLEKSFRVHKGTGPALDLVLKFRVTERELVLESSRLYIID
jgi:hypothetical protein